MKVRISLIGYPMAPGPERHDATKGDQRSPDAMDLEDGLRVARFRANLNLVDPLACARIAFIQNVTGKLFEDDWVGATELVRWPLWRERSAWARGAKWCQR